MKHFGKTPPFRGPRGEPVSGSIAEVRYLRLGGIDQWVMIRGESIANPPLVLLHGGPGMSETSFFRHCNTPLEKSFTVVYWDQRGAGKSFDHRIPTSSMTVEQFVTDLDELVTYVCKRLGTSKVLKERTWIQRFDGQLSLRGLWNMGRLVLAGPESSIVDLPNLLRGFRFSQNALLAEASRLNLLKLAPALQMPVFFFLGRRDHWVPGETSVAYFDALVAPSKTLVWFEESGHEPFVDEPAKFNAAMNELVRPVVVGATSANQPTTDARTNAHASGAA